MPPPASWSGAGVARAPSGCPPRPRPTCRPCSATNPGRWPNRSNRTRVAGSRTPTSTANPGPGVAAAGRPPPPPGRGPLFWVVVVVLVLGFLTVLGCGGLYLALQPKWRTHDSAPGGFKVELPAAPLDDMESMAGVKKNGNVRVEGTLLLVKLEEYSVVYADIDAETRQFQTDDQLLAEAVAGIKSDAPGTRIIRDDPVTVSGYPAREVTFEADGEVFACRVVIAGSRLYIVIAGGPLTDARGNPRVRRFLDSFEVTNPDS